MGSEFLQAKALNPLLKLSEREPNIIHVLVIYAMTRE
jgi:hypothetical protein